MRDGRGGLKQNQAVVGRGDIYTATSQIVREGTNIIDWIVSTERKLEAVFAVLSTMAGACIAAQLGKHRHHVTDIVRIEITTNPSHTNCKGSFLVFMINLELGHAVLDRFHHAALTDLDNVGI